MDDLKEFFREHRAFSEAINERVLTIRFTDNLLTNMVNHWIKDGLIDNEHNPLGSTKKYSIVEIAWINLVSRLKDFSYGSEAILKAKEQILQKVEGLDVTYPVFEYYLTTSLLHENPYCFAFESTGGFTACRFDQHDFLLKEGILENHILIKINPLLTSLLDKIKAVEYVSSKLQLSPEELELVAFIRNNSFESINVVFKNGEIERMEGKEPIDTNKRVIDILREHQFQKIEVIVDNDKVVRINRTAKKKV